MTDSIWLRDLLVSVRLENYFLKFKDADITLPEHFDHVTPNFLSSIGLSEPAQRRLLAAVKKEKKRNKKHLKQYGKNLPTLNYHSNSVKTIDQRGALINPSSLAEGKKLGDGTFGIVVEGVWTSPGGKIDVAIKTLKLGDEADKNAIYDFFEEISVMAELDHRYLLPLYGIVLSQPLKMVMKLAPGGSLQTRLRKQRDFSVLRLCEFSVQIAKGMDYLASKKFVHRDLALRNILIYNQNEVKVGDFGLMRRVNENGEYHMSEDRKIPIAWSSLESLTKRTFSEKSDVWSFGVTVWEMFNYGLSPWSGVKAVEIVRKLKVGERLQEPGKITSDFWVVAQKCWLNDARLRPSFCDLHKILSELMPKEAEVNGHCSDPNRLKVNAGDTVHIIKTREGIALAQNSSSLAIGPISMALLGPVSGAKGSKAGTLGRARVTKNDISAPVPDSFIHAAHGDGKGGTSWGKADQIDPSILENPIVPKKSVSKRRPPPRPVSGPVSVKQPETNQSQVNQQAAQGMDLLGSLSEELAERPVYKEQPAQKAGPKSFQDMHREIGRQIRASSSKVAPQPEITRTYDSFESSSDDENKQVRIYSSERVDSFESDASFYRGSSIDVPRSGSRMAQNLNYYNEVYSSQNLTETNSRESASNYNEVYQVTPETDEDSDEMDALGKELELINRASNLTITDGGQMKRENFNHNPEFLQNGNQNIGVGSNHFPVDFSLSFPTADSALVPKVNQKPDLSQPFPVSFPVLTPSIRPLNPITENRSITPQPIRPSYPAIAERSKTPEPQSPTKQPNWLNSDTNPFAPKYSPRNEQKSMKPEINLEDAFSWFNKKNTKPDSEPVTIPVEEVRKESPRETINEESSPLKLPLEIVKTKNPQNVTNGNLTRDWVDFSSPTQDKIPSFPPSETESREEISEETIIPSKPPRNFPVKNNRETNSTIISPREPALEAKAQSSMNTFPPHLPDLENREKRSSLPKRANSMISPQRPAQVIPPSRQTSIGIPNQRAPEDEKSINNDMSKLAFMSASDAVSALRQKYQPVSALTTSEAKENSQPEREEERDIFARGRKRESITEQKAMRLKIDSVAAKCPFTSEIAIKQALERTNMDTLKAIKQLKTQRLYQVFPENICQKALQRANFDPDYALKILQKHA